MKALAVAKCALVAVVACTVAASPGTLRPPTIVLAMRAHAACGTGEHVWLGANPIINLASSASAPIQVNNITYCSNAGIDMYYYEGVEGPGSVSLAQAGWGVGSGIGSPHAFDEYFDTTGTNFGPYIHQALTADGHFDTYLTRVYYVPGYKLQIGDSFINGNLLDSIGLDWNTGTGLEFLGESYDTYNHWNSYYAGAQYCTHLGGGSACTPNTAVNLPENDTGDSNACYTWASNQSDMYDKRDNGGHC